MIFGVASIFISTQKVDCYIKINRSCKQEILKGGLKKFIKIFNDYKLRRIALFSIPGNYGIQYIDTLMVPLSVSISYTSSASSNYVLMEIFAAVGGILSGIILSYKKIPRRIVMFNGMIIAGLCFIVLAFSHSKYLTLIMFLFISFFLNSQGIYNQIDSNQAPKENDVGYFIALRLLLVYLIKGISAFIAGVAVALFGLKSALFLMALIVIFFGYLFKLKKEQ
ncbi:hypothetical protein PsalN5692_02521 [Piscirickettsia salmonis]|nr:hypothetical protein PsalN5692_02521 [Piscirickettsia salmonis]